MKMRQVAFLICCVVLIGAATSAIPISRLSLVQRLHSAPASTLVTIGTRTVTLGRLRAQHAARELQFSKAGFNGTVLGRGLGVKTPNPRSVSASGLAHVGVLALPVTEPAAQYAATPADMKAFCANTRASACLYLPPQQDVQTWQGAILDLDALIDQSQCTTEEGVWESAGWGYYSCGFTYPESLVVKFTPAANYKVSSAAQCDQTLWQYTVDVHGAISIQLRPQQYLNFTTGSSPWCVVRITVGS